MNDEWQMTGADQWDFGPIVRGVVREIRAFVYFDPDHEGPEGGWRWKAHEATGPNLDGGYAISLQAAVMMAEQAMGIAVEAPT